MVMIDIGDPKTARETLCRAANNITSIRALIKSDGAEGDLLRLTDMIARIDEVAESKTSDNEPNDFCMDDVPHEPHIVAEFNGCRLYCGGIE